VKKTQQLWSIIAVMTVVLAACAPAAAPVTSGPPAVQTVVVQQTVVAQQTVEVKKGKQIGYGAPELAGGQTAIMGGMLQGGKIKNWGIITTSANNDASAQANQVDYFISLGVDAIVVVPVDSKGICASVAKAKAAGIPFFTIDRAPIGCEINMTVQSDNYLAGKQSGEEMVKLLTKKYGSPKGLVLELQGNMGQNVAQLRGGGFDDVMKAYPDIKVLAKPTEWDAAKFSSITLDTVPSQAIDGIYMHSECVGALPVMAALDQLHKKFKRDDPKHIFLVGVDGCSDTLKAIRDGYFDEASSQPIPDFGVVIADYIEKVFNGEAVQAGTVTKEGAPWSPATIVKSDTGWMLNLATTKVTPDNVDNPNLWGNMVK
jgi:ABC-type sugar transport system substrate-binding protein